MRNRYIIIITTVVLVACSGAKKEGLIPRKDLISILEEIHVYDAVATDYTFKTQLEGIDSTILYASIFAKYNTNKAMFDSTMHWYTGQPEELAQIYDIVFGNLDKRNEELDKYITLFEDLEENAIWSLKDNLHILGDTVKYPEPYVVEAEGKGIYLFDLRLRMLPEDKSESPYLVIYFFKDKNDNKPEERMEVCRSVVLKTNYSRNYQYVAELEDNSYKYIKIVLPETPDRNTSKHKNLQIIHFKILKDEINSDSDSDKINESDSTKD